MTEPAAVYAIHVEGVLGPLLTYLLSRGLGVRTEEPSIVLVSVTDDDLVDVAQKLADSGVEIASVREIAVAADPSGPPSCPSGPPPDQAEAPASGGPPSCSRIRYSQNS